LEQKVGRGISPFWAKRKVEGGFFTLRSQILRKQEEGFASANWS
jgi:hypothetical protein